MDTRNPYVILGIPFGSSREEASTAFARKAKQLRARGGDTKHEMTDLTWALNMIDEAIVHADSAMEIYRIPADPAAFAVEGAGAFNPPPERLAARDTDLGAALRALQADAAREALQELLRARSAAQPVPQP